MARPSPYTPEFREEAVQLALKPGKPVAHVARELNVNPGTLRTWVRQYEREHGQQDGPLPMDERAELKELRRPGGVGRGNRAGGRLRRKSRPGYGEAAGEQPLSQERALAVQVALAELRRADVRRRGLAGAAGPYARVQER